MLSREMGPVQGVRTPEITSLARNKPYSKVDKNRVNRTIYSGEEK